ncbi:MAG: hypothetical protein RMM29_08605 [Planctomycetota bacterium]|nr:hypothetical protein [Planctomycetota bacterium]MCX8039939.1 hypothetical protein [Planctomycetota bacterium]MDW8373688.1 hypothetical protein [Planctomycetota bacterium]
MPRPLCLYHRNCLDGKAAAAVVRRRAPEAELLALQYGDPPPTVEGREVYIVDFALPLEAMRALRAQARELLWIDHHASSRALAARLGFGHIDTSTCAAMLAWRVLFPGQPPPPILPYIEDKDLWRWQLPDSRAVAAGLAKAFAGPRLAGLLEAAPAAMAELGRPLLAKQQARVQALLARGVGVSDAYGLPGVRMLAVAANHDQNEIAEIACRPASAGGLGYDLAVLYYRKKDGRWVHSLRSPRIDCAAIAARFGGGGHPASACYVAAEPIVPPS